MRARHKSHEPFHLWGQDGAAIVRHNKPSALLLWHFDEAVIEVRRLE